MVDVGLSCGRSRLTLLDVNRRYGALFIVLLLINRFICFHVRNALPRRPITRFLLLRLRNLCDPFLLFCFLSATFLFLFRFNCRLFVLDGVLLRVRRILFRLLRRVFVIKLLCLLILRCLLVGGRGSRRRRRDCRHGNMCPPFDLRLFFPCLHINVPAVNLLLRFHDRVNKVSEVFRLNTSFRVFRDFLRVSLLLNCNVRIGRERVPSVGVSDFLTSIRVVGDQVGLPIVVVGFP